jgi:hypothetical protein
MTHPMAEAAAGQVADDETGRWFLPEGGVMPAKVWLLNLIVLAVVLEADLGRRKIGWFRVARPLITTAAIVPLFLTSVPASGRNLALQAAGAGVGVLLGLACHLFVSVHFDPAKGKKDGGGRAVSRAGFGYAAFWTVIFGARLVFIYGTEHWFSGPSASSWPPTSSAPSGWATR